MLISAFFTANVCVLSNDCIPINGNNAGGVYVFDFLIEEPFRNAYLANAILQFVEIVHRTARLEAFVIQRKTFNNIFSQPLRSPNTELSTLW